MFIVCSSGVLFVSCSNRLTSCNVIPTPSNEILVGSSFVIFVRCKLKMDIEFEFGT